MSENPPFGGLAGEVTVPSFDHGVGDPVEGGHVVLYSHRVVLVEGNYLLLGQPMLVIKSIVTVTFNVVTCPSLLPGLLAQPPIATPTRADLGGSFFRHFCPCLFFS